MVARSNGLGIVVRTPVFQLPAPPAPVVVSDEADVFVTATLGHVIISTSVLVTCLVVTYNIAYLVGW